MSALEQAVVGPAIEVVAKAARRRFTVEYKRKIVREADACKTPGTLGALLRGEGLYSSHLTTWRAAPYSRRRRPQSALPARARSPRALSAGEQATVLDVLHEPRFVDQAPAEVYATLLDEGHYHCSERTMYRLLAAQNEGRERRNQL